MKPQTKLRVLAYGSVSAEAVSLYVICLHLGAFGATLAGVIALIALCLLSVFVFLPAALGLAIASCAVEEGRDGGFVFRPNRMTRLLGIEAGETLCRVGVDASVITILICAMCICVTGILAILGALSYLTVMNGGVAVRALLEDHSVAITASILICFCSYVVAMGFVRIFRALDERCVRLEE